MNEKELREKYPPRQLGSQAEFDRIMNEIDTDQIHLCRPLVDQDDSLLSQLLSLENHKRAIDMEIIAVKLDRQGVERKRRVINRMFHDLKHEFIMLNPIDGYPKREVAVE